MWNERIYDDNNQEICEDSQDDSIRHRDKKVFYSKYTQELSSSKIRFYKQLIPITKM